LGECWLAVAFAWIELLPRLTSPRFLTNLIMHGAPDIFCDNNFGMEISLPATTDNLPESARFCCRKYSGLPGQCTYKEATAQCAEGFGKLRSPNLTASPAEVSTKEITQAGQTVSLPFTCASRMLPSGDLVQDDPIPFPHGHNLPRLPIYSSNGPPIYPLTRVRVYSVQSASGIC
jgi:hypothetical protein